MRGCLTFLILVAAAVVLGLGYLGFVPVVAGVFGSDRPRDLGVKVTPTDLQSAIAKHGVKLAELPPTTPPRDSIKYSGQKAVNGAFTDEELTALAQSSKWIHNPFGDVQIKIGNDGSFEVSGTLRVSRLQDYAAATGVTSDVVDMVMERLRIVPNSNPPFYLKARGSVTNNHVSGDVQQLEIGRFSVPSNLISDNKAAIIAFLDDKITKIPGLSVRSATLNNGTVQFDGTLPESKSRVVSGAGQ